MEVQTIQKYIHTPPRKLRLVSDMVRSLPPTKALNVYAKYHEKPVVDDVSKKSYYHVIHAPIVHSILVKKTASDTLVRSLIRHDSKKLAEQLFTLID